MSKEEKLYCDRCGKEIKHYFYISDIDNKYLCKNCSDAEDPKELAKQLAELKAENVLYQNGEVLDGDVEVKQWRKISDICQENRNLKVENQMLKEECERKEDYRFLEYQKVKKLQQQLKEKDEEIENEHQKIRKLNDDARYWKDLAEQRFEQIQSNTHQVCEKIRNEGKPISDETIELPHRITEVLGYFVSMELLQKIEKGKDNGQ